ncbi:hypothetical protein HHK36_006074 [Tetracentron sinense]|uniref:Uncharacterized protein n=1 Tax=Tetracentron sinense TaxID=13715 RepID=A0A835DJW3_TETSI|nr:hypothetical protein HHK36_006074 [Tetracentron sinense]
MILEGCKDLEELVGKDCLDFEVDEEILKLTSHIKTFEWENLRLEEDDELYYGCSMVNDDTSISFAILDKVCNYSLLVVRLGYFYHDNFAAAESEVIFARNATNFNHQ